MKKSQNMPVWLNKWVLAQHFLTHFAEAGEVSAHQSWTPAVHWLDSLIDPGGLELVVSPPVCSTSFSFMGGVEKK